MPGYIGTNELVVNTHFSGLGSKEVFEVTLAARKAVVNANPRAVRSTMYFISADGYRGTRTESWIEYTQRGD